MKDRKLIVYNDKGQILYEGKITSFPLNEELVIGKSIEFYSDEAPCFIHRSAVMKRLYAELENFVEAGLEDGRSLWKWDELAQYLQQILKLEDKVSHVTYG